jgi:peroxiredoxin
VGSRAPDFKAVLVKGPGPASPGSLRGKVVVVDFWGTFCEPCKKSFPKLQKLYGRYKEQGFRVLAVSEDEADDKDKIADFVGTYGAAFTIGWDEDKSAAKKYKPETMPSSFVIDRKGVVRYAHVGYHDGDEAEIEHEIKELLGD